MRIYRLMVRPLTLLLIALSALAPSKAVGDTFTDYREQDRTWIVGNTFIQAAFQLDPNGVFHYRWLDDRTSHRLWRGLDSNPSSPIKLSVDGATLDETSHYALQSYSFSEIDTPAVGVRLSLDLQPDGVAGLVHFEADVYDGQPFVRYRTSFRNTGPQDSYVTEADMLAWKFQDNRDTYRDFFVGQWKFARAANFEPHETNLSQVDGPARMYTGAYADHTAWRAVRDSHDNGLVAAWEFDGRTLADLQHARSNRMLRFSAEISDLNHRVSPGDSFAVPDAFIGVFHGNWDEAGYRTQQFAEQVLAAPMPEADKFPYVMFDTWGYGEGIDESVAFADALRASEMGAEVFILDLGWARNIGDWRPDPAKFPNGLRPLSDYVHSLGMKFGLHLPLLEAAKDSPVLLSHPDWEAVETNRPRTYFGASSLCPSHLPARQWIISETIRVIRQYRVDWLTQDGENMVKVCESENHTHAPGDSNYSNAVDGLDAIIRAVQAATPGVVWENCEDGGSMQTFHMIQRYVTSVVNDCDDALTTRQAVFGASYPFPLRYTERYMMDEPENTYRTRSYMFGGPFIIMNRISKWSGNTVNSIKREIALYKSLRGIMRDARVYHLTPRPDGLSSDAMEAHDTAADRSVLFVYSDEGKSTVSYVRAQGLDPNALYKVGFLEVPHSYLASGAQLMQKDIPVIVPPWTTEVISIVRP